MVQSNLVGVVGGLIAILIGLYSLFQTDSVVRWLNSQGVPHTPDRAAQLRQTKLVGIACILFGCYFMYAALTLWQR